jgi:hypothetical protein
MLSIMISEEDRRQAAMVQAARSVTGSPIMPLGETSGDPDASVGFEQMGCLAESFNGIG